MTKLLEQAVREASSLPEEEQDTLAAWLMEEIRSEREWESSFNRSADALSRLAADALAEHLAGRTEPLDVEKL